MDSTPTPALTALIVVVSARSGPFRHPATDVMNPLEAWERFEVPPDSEKTMHAITSTKCHGRCVEVREKKKALVDARAGAPPVKRPAVAALPGQTPP